MVALGSVAVAGSGPALVVLASLLHCGEFKVHICASSGPAEA